MWRGRGSGAGGGGDDGAFIMEERVEQARFADIGLADDDGESAFLQDAAERRGAEELLELGADFSDARGEFGADVGLDAFLGEIEAGLEVAEEIDQFGADGLESGAEFAFLHRAGAGEGAFGRRVEEIEETFGLGEGELAVEERALRIFTGTRCACAEFQAGAAHVRHDVRVAVAGNFHCIFTRVGMGALPEREHDIVEDFALVGEGTVEGVAGFPVGFVAEEMTDDAAAVGAAKAEHGERGYARRGAEGDDGIGRHCSSV